MENFEKIKSIVLEKAKEAGACTSQYYRALKSNSLESLCQVLKDNFNWGCANSVITPDLIETFKSDFAAFDIFVNANADRGFLLASGSATVRASGSATVRAWDSATVEAWDSATVEAWDSATVRAWDSATVRAWDSATVRASGSATVRASGSATVRASGSATVEAWGSATVRASGSAYISCSSAIECAISDKALIRRYDTNIIQFCDDTIKFEKVQNCDKSI